MSPSAFVAAPPKCTFIPSRSHASICIRPVNSNINVNSCRSTIHASTEPQSTSKKGDLERAKSFNYRPVRFAALVALVIYVPSIIHPGMPSETAEALTDAFKLGVNFAFVTPIVFPDIAPVYSPIYEAIYNFVIFWFTLFLGFLSEDACENNNYNNTRVPFTPFAFGGLFLTNLFYLPYLVVRTPNPGPVAPVSTREPSALLRCAEGRALPLKIAVLGLVSIAWAIFGRPDMYSIHDISRRLASVPDLLAHSVLCKAMFIDTIPLSIFQSALVDDDVKRRNWTGAEKDTAVRAARFLPFFGLCYYLWKRANCASLININNNNNNDNSKNTKSSSSEA